MRYFWFVIFVLSVGSVSAQNSARVRELEKQRKAALAEIEMTSQLLDETRQTARKLAEPAEPALQTDPFPQTGHQPPESGDRGNRQADSRFPPEHLPTGKRVGK